MLVAVAFDEVKLVLRTCYDTTVSQFHVIIIIIVSCAIKWEEALHKSNVTGPDRRIERPTLLGGDICLTTSSSGWWGGQEDRVETVSPDYYYYCY